MTRTFGEWLRSRRITDTPRGDAIADTLAVMRTDPTVATPEAVLHHLGIRGACPDARREVERLVRQYARECYLG